MERHSPESQGGHRGIVRCLLLVLDTHAHLVVDTLDRGCHSSQPSLECPNPLPRKHGITFRNNGGHISPLPRVSWARLCCESNPLPAVISETFGFYPQIRQPYA
jgi:hypothetical protein